jgi:hypothetical protein
MLTHKRIISASLAVVVVLASLIFISPVKAVNYAEMPPYDDEWTLTSGSNYPYADANLSAGRLTVFMYPLTTKSSTAQVEIWKRVWLPATAVEITYSWKLKGSLMCDLYLSFTGVELYIFVDKCSNSERIDQTTLFDKYVDLQFEYQESIDINPPPASKVVSIPEAGYYNIGVGLAGEAGGLLANCDFGVFEGEGAWVSMNIHTATFKLSISSTLWGNTNPYPGTYTYTYGDNATVRATPWQDCIFQYWVLDGLVRNENPITVTMTRDHSLKAYFYASGGGDGCPTLYSWDGYSYVDYGVINIHNPSGEDVVQEVPIRAQDVGINNYMAKFRLREGWPGLNYSESVIDQVKLYVTDSHGNRHLCPLIGAIHSRLGNVLPQLIASDDYRVQTFLLETIDLTFIVPYQNIQSFTFRIEGCNRYKM